ncbi:MAG: hypothetical protein HY554_06495 [Elusimicrobia bacterium]|nr:hypothetical protein [Elusimicrobiota bacterium]
MPGNPPASPSPRPHARGSPWLAAGAVLALALVLGVPETPGSQTLTVDARYPIPIGAYHELVTTGSTALGLHGGDVELGTSAPFSRVVVNGVTVDRSVSGVVQLLHPRAAGGFVFKGRDGGPGEPNLLWELGWERGANAALLKVHGDLVLGSGRGGAGLRLGELGAGRIVEPYSTGAPIQEPCPAGQYSRGVKLGVHELRLPSLCVLGGCIDISIPFPWVEQVCQEF